VKRAVHTRQKSLDIFYGLERTLAALPDYLEICDQGLFFLSLDHQAGHGLTQRQFFESGSQNFFTARISATGWR